MTAYKIEAKITVEYDAFNTTITRQELVSGLECTLRHHIGAGLLSGHTAARIETYDVEVSCQPITPSIEPLNASAVEDVVTELVDMGLTHTVDAESPPLSGGLESVAWGDPRDPWTLFYTEVASPEYAVHFATFTTNLKTARRRWLGQHIIAMLRGDETVPVGSWKRAANFSLSCDGVKSLTVSAHLPIEKREELLAFILKRLNGAS